MTTEQQKAFEAWWSDPAPWSFEGNNREIFCAGWNAAMENRLIVVETVRLVARQDERHELRKRIIERAGEAFVAGLDERARLYREIAEEFFGKQG